MVEFDFVERGRERRKLGLRRVSAWRKKGNGCGDDMRYCTTVCTPTTLRHHATEGLIIIEAVMEETRTPTHQSHRPGIGRLNWLRRVARSEALCTSDGASRRSKENSRKDSGDLKKASAAVPRAQIRAREGHVHTRAASGVGRTRACSGADRRGMLEIRPRVALSAMSNSTN